MNSLFYNTSIQMDMKSLQKHECVCIYVCMHIYILYFPNLSAKGDRSNGHYQAVHRLDFL